jgi:hypothetical protein
MMFRKKQMSPAILAAKQEEVRSARGDLSLEINKLDRVKVQLAQQLETVMSNMIAETHKGRGNG